MNAARSHHLVRQELSWLILLSICLFPVCVLSSTESDTTAVESPKEQYQILYEKAVSSLGRYEFTESIKYCEEALLCNPRDYVTRAILCLDYYEMAEELDVKKTGDKKSKMEMYNKMLLYSGDGIRAAPDRGECYFMHGLANARIATTQGVLSSLFKAKEIEKDWLMAVQKKSDFVTPDGDNLSASSNIGLGVYYRLCPSFFLLKWLFGIHGDINKSVAYCRKAYQIDPARTMIAKEYGISLITRGLENKNQQDIEQGKKYLQQVASLPLRLDSNSVSVAHRTENIDIEHSRMLLKNIKLCPGYSRDQQQENSETAYRKMKKEEKEGR